MRVEPLGESALILRELSAPPYLVAEALNLRRPPGFIEAVASYDTVGVFFDPQDFDPNSLHGLQVEDVGHLPKVHVIPVCYELGDDLKPVSERLGFSPDRVAELHTGTIYRCYAIGFCPGFPYLGDLPPELRGVERLLQPRVRVPSGSVAITGKQTGIYPLERPGGWSIIGRTPLVLVDVEDDYFPIRAGDQVRFERIEEKQFQILEGERL